MNLTKSFLFVNLPAFRDSHDDHMMGQGDGVVVELEQVCVGEDDGEHVLERLGKEIRVERNSSKGTAVQTVAEILDKFGNSLYMEPEF